MRLNYDDKMHIVDNLFKIREYTAAEVTKRYGEVVRDENTCLPSIFITFQNGFGFKGFFSVNTDLRNVSVTLCVDRGYAGVDSILLTNRKDVYTKLENSNDGWETALLLLREWQKVKATLAERIRVNVESYRTIYEFEV